MHQSESIAIVWWVRADVRSSELIVKVIDAKDPLKVQLLAGHKKGVREATWSPDGSLLVRTRSRRRRRVTDEVDRRQVDRMVRFEFGN